MEKLNNEPMEPRITALEIGQENLYREVSSLTSAVKDQGYQLTQSISKLAEASNANYQTVLEKINTQGKTDWQTFWTMIAAVIMILGAISTPIWITFSEIDKNFIKQELSIDKIEKITFESIKDRAELNVKLEYQQKTLDKINKHHVPALR
jgi:hypothetical protein